MSIAINAIAGAGAIFDETLAYAKNRTAFGQPIGSFQDNRFVLAALDTGQGRWTRNASPSPT